MAVFKNEQRGTWTVKVRYTDWTGSTKQKKKEGFKTKKEAQLFEVDFLNSCKTDINITFENLVIDYMEYCKTRLKPTTFANKEYLITTKLLPYFAKMPLSTIEVSTVMKWQNELIKDSRNYAPTYLKTVHNQLSAILNYAVKYYSLPFNAAAKCGSMGKKNAESMQIWTKEEFDNFIVAVSDKPASQLIFTLLFYSGMRSGELLALTLNDFDFEKGSVNITKTYSRLNGSDLIQEPKTPKSRRSVTLPHQVLAMVKEYMQHLYQYRPDERLFTVTKYYLHHEMRRGCKHSKVKVIRVHDLRHSHASLLIELGFSPLLISERLGHENIETTLNTYSHLYPNKHSEVSDKLATLI